MTYKKALEIVRGLSKTTKMPCFGWSISAKGCKRAKLLKLIKNSVCGKCYALRGYFGFPFVQAALDRNEQTMKHPLWVQAMATVIKVQEQSGFFRWFPSGDIRDLQDLLNICEICRLTPHIKHWLPTHEIGILAQFKRLGYTYPSNLIVRVSGDMINKEPPKSLLNNLGVLGGAVNKSKYTCPAPDQENMCLDCRRCWSKKVKIVTYLYH